MFLFLSKGGDDDDVVMQKPENPTEWWMQMCPETELDNLEHSGKLVVLMEILKECEAIGDKLYVSLHSEAQGWKRTFS